MRVICIYNTSQSLPSDLIFEGSTARIRTDFRLIIGKEYVVYAMTVNDGYVWYYVCERDHSDYPVWKPCPFFEVINFNLSRYWIYSYIKVDNYIKAIPMWAYPEWALDPDYYDRLTDGENSDVDIFKKYKELMDLEFPDEAIKAAAQIGDDEWLICPSCLDGWQSQNHLDALVRCANCKTVLNNPRYYNLHHRDHRGTNK